MGSVIINSIIMGEHLLKILFYESFYLRDEVLLREPMRMMTPKMTAKIAKRLKRIPIRWDQPQRMMMRPIMIPQI